MNRVTKGLVDSFCRDQGLESLPVSSQFEHFTTDIILNRYFGGDYDVSDVVVGSGGDTGIDAIAIIINGRLIVDLDDFRDVSDQSNSLDVTFIFVQAETSSSFDSQKIGQFQFGVEDFFRDEPTLPRSNVIADRAEVASAIYSASGKFKKAHPTCRLFYITTGKWQADPHLEARRIATIGGLKAMDQFGDIEFLALGNSEIGELYRRSQNAISRQFRFPHRSAIEGVAGVKQAFIGYVDASQYLTLIRDEDGDIIRRLFYENVRDWQDFNPVNKEIQETLSSDHSDRFVLMNNGITLIAKRAVLTNNNMLIEDYQVVNGCQTSYVLHHEDVGEKANVSIPLRLIETDDDEVTASIIRATNRQTEVKEDQFLALTEFAKVIESFFKTFSDGEPLYYERRLRQYGGDHVDRLRIIAPAVLIRAFASMFLGEPHSVTRSYSSVQGKVGGEIFVPGHRLEPYYVSAFASYKLEKSFKTGTIGSELKPARYHVLLAMRLLISGDELPRMNSGEMGRFCDTLCPVLWDNQRSESLIGKAAEVIAAVAKGNYHRDHIRTQSFTGLLVDECRKARRSWSC